MFAGFGVCHVCGETFCRDDMRAIESLHREVKRLGQSVILTPDCDYDYLSFDCDYIARIVNAHKRLK